ncbi:hypothetical protein Tco_0486737 [Tanacetum coccineum]
MTNKKVSELYVKFDEYKSEANERMDVLENKFDEGHRCPSKTLQVLLVMDDKDKDDEDNIETKKERINNEFNVDGDYILIEGDPSLNRSLVSLKSISRSLKLKKNGYLVELKYLGEPQEAGLPSNEAIFDLLKEF